MLGCLDRGAWFVVIAGPWTSLDVAVVPVLVPLAGLVGAPLLEEGAGGTWASVEVVVLLETDYG